MKAWMKEDMKEIERKFHPNGHTLSYDTLIQIEMKAGPIETHCCRLSYKTDTLVWDNDKTKEKPCIPQ